MEHRYQILCSATLSTRVFETRTATGSELFSLLTCLHTTAFALQSIFSPLEMLGIKIWETPLSWHAKCPLPVVVLVSKTCVLKLPINSTDDASLRSKRLRGTGEQRLRSGILPARYWGEIRRLRRR